MGNRHIREAEYKQIKGLLASGMSQQQVADAVGRGRMTVMYIHNTDNYADFRRKRLEISHKYKPLVGKSQYRVGKHKLKQKEYDQIKMLASVGLNNVKIADIIGKSAATISRVKATANWEDYQTFLATVSAKRQETLVSKVEPTLEPINDLGEDFVRKGDTEVPNDMVTTLLQANAEAMNSLAIAFNHFSDKLDEVIETKRPWLGRIK